MQCVILAAGRGERMRELSEGTPKALLEVQGKTLLEYKLEALPDEVDEILIVVGYMGSEIQNYLGGDYNGKHIFYVEQDETRHGTGGALWSAKDVLHDTFIVMNADDIYAKEDIASAAKATPWAMFGYKTNSIGSGAKIETNKKGKVTDIVESDGHEDGAGYVNTGLFTLDARVFEHPLVPKTEGSNEFGLPQTLLKSGEHLELVPATFWVQVTNPEDLEKAAQILDKRG